MKNYLNNINKDWVVRFGYGFIFGCLVMMTGTIFAQVINENSKSNISISKADLFYSATSTRTKGLDTYDITLLKAKYDDTDRILVELKDIKDLLKRIEKNTRK